MTAIRSCPLMQDVLTIPLKLLTIFVLLSSGTLANSALQLYSEWLHNGPFWRMNAGCTINLPTDYSPQAAQQGFIMKITLQDHATGNIEVFYPFDNSATTSAGVGDQVELTLRTAPGVWVTAGTKTYNFLIEFINLNGIYGQWPQGTCSGPFTLDPGSTTASIPSTLTTGSTTASTSSTASTDAASSSSTSQTSSGTTSSSPSSTTTAPTTTSSSQTNADICAGTVSHTGSGYNYEEVLCKSILFYEAQRSGNLDEATNRVPWRKDSALGDGGDVGQDLTGGWYDAGDYVKFNFPMASATSFLAWGLNQWSSAYNTAGQYSYMLDTIRWPLDYFLKSWKSTQNRLYAQVGDGYIDHGYMGRPEDMTMSRPSLFVNTSHPGTDLAAEMAAALAAGSLAFYINDLSYSDTLLANAKSLFDFAYYNNKGKYNEGISNGNFYSSSGYWDELAWAAAMLYSATNNQSYITIAKQIYDSNGLNAANAWSFDWDNKHLAAAILIYDHTGDSTIRSQIQSFFTNWRNGQQQGNQITPGGLVWRIQWGSLRHAANVAFAALMAADVGVWDAAQARDTREWARGQLDYMLGDNPNSRSYVVGFGTNPPKQPHHRSSFCEPDAPCTWDKWNDITRNNYYTLYGALVGGPDQNDTYSDVRTDFIKNEVACDYNAGFQSALAGIIDWLTH